MSHDIIVGGGGHNGLICAAYNLLHHEQGAVADDAVAARSALP